MTKWVNYKGRKCCLCGNSESSKNWFGNPNWYKHLCEKKDCTKFICKKCYMTNWRDADWRKGNLNPLSTSGKGFIGQQIVARTYGVEDCNLKMNSFRFYIDLDKISGYGYCEVKIATLDIRAGSCGIWYFSLNRIQEYDNIFLLCMDNNWPWKSLERVYVFPWEIIINRYIRGLGICKCPSRGIQWYDEFKIDEKKFDDTYHNMRLENCKILRK